MKDKIHHLMNYVDLERPELKTVRGMSNPAEAFVQHLARYPRPRFRFEYERKPEILSFLQKRYEAWRNYDKTPADKISAMSIREAQGERALSGIIELGKAWWATGDPKYGSAFQRFYLETKTGEMFNWDSFNGSQGAHELDAWFLLLDCPGFTEEGRIAFLDHLLAITYYAWDDATSQWGQLALGPEGHNWYLHGMHCLPFVGILFPEFKRSEFFVKTGWSVVEEHLRGHYKSDGGARETTLGYQNGSVYCLWDFCQLARRNGIAMSEGFTEKLLNATKFLLRLMSPDGGLPSFGDTQPGAGQLILIASMATALTGDRECKWYAEHCRKILNNFEGEKEGELPLTAFWCVGLEGAGTYAQTRPRNPNHTSALMGPTGYVAMRDSDSPDANYMAVACADRGPIVTSHGHTEIFSMDVHADGIRFIGEMGCAPYGTSKGRMYDESTEAHTCLAVAGREQCAIVNEWRWSQVVIPVVRRWISEPTHDFFHAVHEGYYTVGKSDTLHGRKIFFIKPCMGVPFGYWVVMDWLESVQKNDYRAYFHGCVPGRLKGKTILLGDSGRTNLAVIPPQGDKLSVKQVHSDGLSAYIREKNIDAKRYPCFVYANRSASDCLVWALVPMTKGRKTPIVRRVPVKVNGIREEAHGATAVEIRFGKHTDLLCVSHKDFDNDLEFGNQQTWGFLAFRRFTRTGRVALSVEHTMSDGVCGR